MNDLTTKENAPERPSAPDGSPKQFRSLRAWPAFLLALLMLAARFGPGLLEEGAAKYWMAAVFGPLLCCLLLLVWWLAASRATWRERLFGFLGLVASAAITITLAHPSMRGAATTYFTLPMGFLLFALRLSNLCADSNKGIQGCQRGRLSVLGPPMGGETILWTSIQGHKME